MKMTLTKEEKESLFFILEQFNLTHIDCGLYKKEVRIAKKVIKKLNI